MIAEYLQLVFTESWTAPTRRMSTRSSMSSTD